ncbi:agamous-like MADS-box protein AGL61 [Apium graveolens]|uniref:agamous-like MADS-box protein AGL61 n=1 Tax=Apium graveolens TaxID=4045 RepID=UPI003D7BB742
MGTGKKKIEIKMKEKEQDRMVAFSKRRKGLFKKAHQLHALSGAKIAILVFSPAGKPYIYGEPCFTDTVDKYYHNATASAAAADEDNVRSDNPSTHGGVNYDEDKDCHEIEALKSCLERVDLEGCDSVDDLLKVKKDLEQARDRLIKNISDINA